HISYGSLYSSDVDDLGPGLLGLGHEPLRLPSHQPPVACRECGGVLLPGPSARDVGPAGSFRTRSSSWLLRRLRRSSVRHSSPSCCSVLRELWSHFKRFPPSTTWPRWLG